MKLHTVLIFWTSITVAFTQSNRRVTNGEDADIAEFPHALGIFIHGKYSCGASVISIYWAITAAHCLMGKPNDMQLYGNSTNKLEGGIFFRVARYTVHPGYNDITLSNGETISIYDVGVLQVYPNNPLQGLFIRPTILPPPCHRDCCLTCQNNIVTLAGWGLTHENIYPDKLQQVNQTILSQNYCESYFEHKVTGTIFCATSAFYDSCNGDSGSGILLADRIHQIGVVSSGESPCGQGIEPAIYVRLEHPNVREFIRVVTGI